MSLMYMFIYLGKTHFTFGGGGGRQEDFLKLSGLIWLKKNVGLPRAGFKNIIWLGWSSWLLRECWIKKIAENIILFKQKAQR